MSAASCASSPNCRSTRSRGSKRSRGSEINEAKKVLATEATALCHGRDAADAAAETARSVFDEGGSGGELPTVDVPRAALERGMPAFELFAAAGLAASNGEARRLIRGGGARINDGDRVERDAAIGLADLTAQGVDQAQRRQEAPRTRAAELRQALYCGGA